MRLVRLFALVCAVGLALSVRPAATQPGPPTPPAKKPTVDSELKVPVNQLTTIVVTAAGSAEGGIGSTAVFKAPPDGPYFTYRQYKDGQHRFEFQSVKPGRYTIVFWVKGEIDGVYTTIIVGDPKNEDQGPTDQDIKPATKPLGRIVLVTDGTAAQTTIRAPYLTGTFPGEYKALGFEKDRPDTLDKGDTPLSEKAQELLKLSEGKKAQYFVLATDKSIIRQGDLPDKPDDLIKILKKLKGK
jgi:hypothetical protein